MKTKNIFIITLLLCSHICFAQKQLFDKYADMDNITLVHISKAMFNLMPKLDVKGMDIDDIKSKIESLSILTTEDSGTKSVMAKDFKAQINSEYEELMRVKDKNDNLVFYVKNSGSTIKEFIMLGDTDNEFIVIQLTGNFLLSDLQKIADKVQ